MNYKEIYDQEYNRVKQEFFEDFVLSAKEYSEDEMTFITFMNETLQRHTKINNSFYNSFSEEEKNLFILYKDNLSKFQSNKIQNTIKRFIVPKIEHSNSTNLKDLILKISKYESLDKYTNYCRNHQRIFELMYELKVIDRFKEVFDDTIENYKLEKRMLDLRYPDRDKTWGTGLAVSLVDQVKSESNNYETKQKEIQNTFSEVFSNEEKYILLNILFKSIERDIKNHETIINKSEFLRIIALCGSFEYSDELLTMSSSKSKDYNRFNKGSEYVERFRKNKNEELKKLITKLKSISPSNFSKTITIIRENMSIS